jgi:inositol transport system permease protein
MNREFMARARITLILAGIIAAFEISGWLIIGQSFIFNLERVPVIILQVAVVGIISVGVTQVIIMGGIDLSSGSVLAFSAMVAASFAQSNDAPRIYFPHLTGLPVILPIAIGVAVGALAGFVNGAIIAFTGVPPFIPTLGMLVFARGLAVLWGQGTSVTGFTRAFNSLGFGIAPIVIFATTAILFHVILRRTVCGRRTYAIGSNEEAARISGINVRIHKLLVYSIAGGLSGLAGVVVAAQATMVQPGMGVGYELDAISAAVIGVLILGVITSGFTMLRIDSDYQAVVKGLIILVAVFVDRRRHEFVISAKAR